MKHARDQDNLLPDSKRVKSPVDDSEAIEHQRVNEGLRRIILKWLIRESVLLMEIYADAHNAVITPTGRGMDTTDFEQPHSLTFDCDIQLSTIQNPQNELLVSLNGVTIKCSAWERLTGIDVGTDKILIPPSMKNIRVTIEGVLPCQTKQECQDRIQLYEQLLIEEAKGKAQNFDYSKSHHEWDWDWNVYIDEDSVVLKHLPEEDFLTTTTI